MAGKYLKKKRKRWVYPVLGILLVLFAGMIVVSICKITSHKQERDAGVEAYDSLAHSVVTVLPEEQSAPDETKDEKPEPEVEVPAKIDVTRPSLEVNFEALNAINGQVVAWISSDTGAINYPVVRGTDNDYYLNHLVDGTSNANGSIFMDFRNASGFSDRNTFIYGHNMLNGAMFASLTNYASQSYYEQHPELLLVTPKGSYSLQVIAGCVVPGNSDVYQLSFKDDAEFAAYLEKIRVMSDFVSPVEMGMGDKLVSFSTCAYNYDDARYVVFCKLVAMQ